GLEGEGAREWVQAMHVLGCHDMALLLATCVALLTWWRLRRTGFSGFAEGVGDALMTGGVIVLITCAGGAFGAALRAAELAPAIQGLAGDSDRKSVVEGQ